MIDERGKASRATTYLNLVKYFTCNFFNLILGKNNNRIHTKFNFKLQENTST